MAKNYRPVSLLPIVSRILEYFVKQQVTDNLTEHKLFPESQFAYRRQHSTEDAVVLAINRWLMAKAERKYTGVVMVDMSKAFDRVFFSLNHGHSGATAQLSSNVSNGQHAY